MDNTEDQVLITPGMARKLGLKRYRTGKLCGRGHMAQRYVSNGRCVECQTEDQRKPKVDKPVVEQGQLSEYESGYRDGMLDGLIDVFHIVKSSGDVLSIKAGLFDKIVDVKEMYSERSE